MQWQPTLHHTMTAQKPTVCQYLSIQLQTYWLTLHQKQTLALVCLALVKCYDFYLFSSEAILDQHKIFFSTISCNKNHMQSSMLPASHQTNNPDTPVTYLSIDELLTICDPLLFPLKEKKKGKQKKWTGRTETRNTHPHKRKTYRMHSE